MRVWNRREINVPIGATYVGRPTMYGNPYEIGKDGTREEVIEKFRQHVMDHPGFHAQIIKNLKGKDLVCWCYPEACHATVLFEIANE